MQSKKYLPALGHESAVTATALFAQLVGALEPRSLAKADAALKGLQRLGVVVAFQGIPPHPDEDYGGEHQRKEARE